MELKNPVALALLLLWIPMVWVYLRRERRARPAVRYSDLSMARTVSPSLRVRLRHSLLVLRMLALALLVIALARPRKGETSSEITTEGVDIVIALDISSTMRSLDFKPMNRIHVAKECTKAFIAKRQHDRIGLVVFASRAFTKCPLTLDYGILTQFVDQVDVGDVEDGTAIGTAVATAANRLMSTKAKSKVIILVTDGDNNRGDIAPETAAKAAADVGIKIYTIGVGREGQVPYPVEAVDPWSGKTVQQVQMIESPLNEPMLMNMAEVTGGRFFRAQNAEKLAEIYDLIDKLEKTEIKTLSYTNYEERFFPWLLAGALLALLELILANTVFRRIP